MTTTYKITTVILNKNWIGRESDIAAWQGIENYISFMSDYNEDKEQTIIQYKQIINEDLPEELKIYGQN